MFEKLYKGINENGKLEFEKAKSKEEILLIMSRLFKMAEWLDGSRKPTDEMIQYFEKEFDIECIVEFVHRHRKIPGDSTHGIRYIEQDLPLADEKTIEKLAKDVLKAKSIDDEIAALKAAENEKDEDTFHR